jgi:hypothetical protein
VDVDAGYGPDWVPSYDAIKQHAKTAQVAPGAVPGEIDIDATNGAVVLSAPRPPAVFATVQDFVDFARAAVNAEPVYDTGPNGESVLVGVQGSVSQRGRLVTVDDAMGTVTLVKDPIAALLGQGPGALGYAQIGDITLCFTSECAEQHAGDIQVQDDPPGTDGTVDFSLDHHVWIHKFQKTFWNIPTGFESWGANTQVHHTPIPGEAEDCLLAEFFPEYYNTCGTGGTPADLKQHVLFVRKDGPRWGDIYSEGMGVQSLTNARWVAYLTPFHVGEDTLLFSSEICARHSGTYLGQSADIPEQLGWTWGVDCKAVPAD